MMIHTSFYTLVILILFSILTVIYSADPEDPCPSGAGQDKIVADMCTDDFAIEDNNHGSKEVDSVLLRITKQQTNCICHVSLLKPVTNYTIYMSKYDDLHSAAPIKDNCGLAVDVDYQETSDSTRSNQSIECTSGTNMRSIALGGSELKLKSRIIDGDFTRGYCMQISRDQAIYTCNMNDQEGKAGTDRDWIVINDTQRHSSIDECKQYCIQKDFCVAVHYDTSHCFVYNRMTTLIVKQNATYSQKHCVDTQKLKIKCDLPELTTQTDQVITTEFVFTTKKETVTTTISDSTLTYSNTHLTITEETKITKDENFDLYVYLGAAAGGLLVILLIVCIIVCIRKKVNQAPLKESKNDSTKQFGREDRDSDNDYGGLKDNVLYVSSEPEPNEILEDGNYNTVDLEQTRKVNQDNNFDGNYSTVDGTCSIIGSYSDSSLCKSKPVIKPKPKTNGNSSLKRGSDEETLHLSTMNNSNNEYAVVDKGRNSDAVKHIHPEHGNDTEYAVVNKVKKSSNNN